MLVRLGDNEDTTKVTIEALRKVIKRMHGPLEVMLTWVRWYVTYPLSLRHIEELMAERGVFVAHATVHRWAQKTVPVLVKVFRGRKPRRHCRATRDRRKRVG
jgi:transposase-like protein